MKPLASIIVPVFNEEGNVQRLYDEVSRVMAGLADRWNYEILFTDNHSRDRTFDILREIAAADDKVRVVRFSKNFGFQRSILSGYLKARGDVAVQIDADLQDPPDLIPAFLAKWEDGYDVVYGVRKARREGRLIGWARSLFYRLIDALAEDELPHHAGDFRLVSRRVLDALELVDDQHPYLRGIIAGFGFAQTGIPYDRAKRTSGESKFSFGQLMRLALDGILAHSIIPLRIATLAGIAMSALMIIAMVVYLVGKAVFDQDWPPGFATITILLLISITLNALFLGIIGEYLGRIYQQVKKRPLTLTEQTLNFPQEPSVRKTTTDEEP